MTRTLAPRLASGMVPRTSLVNRLMDARRKRCIVLQGPPGSGKTSLLLAMRGQLLTHGFEVAWLSLSQEDGDLDTFLQGLIASLGGLDPALVRPAALLAGEGPRDADAVEHCMIALAQGLAARSGELVLMIDDVHLLTTAPTLQALTWLLDYAPSAFHLVLACREAPQHPLGTAVARLRQRQMAVDFSWPDLRFSLAESQQFVQSRLGALAQQEAMRLHKRTDGWIAGLQLLCLHYKEPATPLPEMPLRDAGSFAAYFEQHVLEHLSAADVELLTRVAICHRVCADLGAALLDGARSPAQIEQRLAALERDSLFIAQEQERGQHVWWRLHPLLREVLQARIEGGEGETLPSLHRRAWRWFAVHQIVSEAVHHAVLAGEAEAAVAMLSDCSRELLERGEFALIKSLLRRLPVQLLQRHVGLRLAQAHVHLNSREFAALDAGLAALAGEPLTPLQRAELDLLHCATALHRDDVDAAARALGCLESLPAGADALLRSTRANLTAWTHLARGEYALAREVLGRRHAQHDGPVARLTGMCLEGLLHTLEGRMGDAEHLYRQVLDAECDGPAGVQLSQLAAALLGDVLYEMDELDAACALLDSRMDLIEHAGIPEAILRAALVLASAHWLCGRRLEALAQLDRLEDHAARRELPRLQAHALCLRVRLQQQRGEMLAVSEALCKLDELAARRRGQEDSVSQEIMRLAERAQIAVHLNRGELAPAADGLRALLQRFQAAGRLRPAAALLAQLALVERNLGNEAEAVPMLIDALRLGHRLGLVHTLLDVSRRVPAALHGLVESGTLEPVLAFYAQRLLDVAGRQRALHGVAQAPAAQREPLEPLKERELEILGLLAQALPNKKIARVLGLSPETVKWHLKNIYLKLGVSARDAAVARARDLQR
ncbi:LuxR C-terminal-related transcriptional regulator [Xenophilus arseniciresistens]|uniref:LuxR C-terminal-related transcriptional regulator n=1 Tax=Xenophilus arseniciresistens TaxID=1283306 RepID=A0AAE3SXS9_9BURK|nr:LuxR C-terminal-related transcriptional regulator [Xenophilus arseniciresistens]MDA7415322.1 LuxR C-terminal-related transcriptional regulator [Xenophilus arseniciresistens]